MASGDVTTGGSTSGSTNPQVDKTATTLLKGLRTAYKGGVDVYGQPLYTDPSQTTQNAWRLGSDSAGGLVNSGGLTDQMRSAMGTFGDIGTGYGGVGANGGLTSAQSSAMSGLGGLGGQFAGLGGLNATQTSAMGKTGGLGDAYGGLATAYDPNSAAYQTLRGGISDSVLSDVASLGASNGRYGATSFNKGAAEGLGQALAGLDYSNMQNNVNNQYRSLDSQKGIYDTLFNQGQQGRDNSMGALTAQQGVYGDQFNMGQTGQANKLAALSGQQGAASSLFNAGQTGLGNVNQAVGQLGAIGASQDADALAKRLADANLFDQTKNADWNTLARASSIFGGTAGQTTQQTSNTIPWWSALLGTAATAASFIP